MSVEYETSEGPGINILNKDTPAMYIEYETPEGPLQCLLNTRPPRALGSTF